MRSRRIAIILLAIVPTSVLAQDPIQSRAKELSNEFMREPIHCDSARVEDCSEIAQRIINERKAILARGFASYCAKNFPDRDDWRMCMGVPDNDRMRNWR